MPSPNFYQKAEAEVAKFFVMFSTDPDVDPRKCVVGLACAAQAVSDGHQVQTFFASHSVKLLHADYINAIDSRVGMPDGASRAMLISWRQGHRLHARPDRRLWSGSLRAMPTRCSPGVWTWSGADRLVWLQ